MYTLVLSGTDVGKHPLFQIEQSHRLVHLCLVCRGFTVLFDGERAGWCSSRTVCIVTVRTHADSDDEFILRQ